MKCDIGVVGLAVMGKNLALNMEDHGFHVAVFNRTSSKTIEMVAENPGKNLTPVYSPEQLCAQLEKPRRIVLMVKAGGAVDKMIETLLPYLERGDIVADAGNSYYKDTIRREKRLSELGLHFIGMGVSGGEEGARFGPAIMPGGNKEAYKAMAPVLLSIAAQVNDEPCCTYIGENGAGHYVKMVHNGIEYADMQMISEACYLLRTLLDAEDPELAGVFSDWNEGELNSYLIEITADILSQKDEDTGLPMTHVILDKAGQKGTGKWTGMEALDLGAAAPTIADAVFARNISAMKEERVKASKVLSGPESKGNGNKEEIIEIVRRALYASKVCAYSQGFSLMRAAAQEYGWTLDYGAIAKIFRGGCIIRAQFLNRITQAYERDPGLPNLLLDPYFTGVVESYQSAWRDAAAMAVKSGASCPALLSALSYFDAYRSARLPANLIQAQRDYFGAHTYQRTDKEGVFHREWIKGQDA